MITTFDFPSDETASKYHQSQEVPLTADNWGPSRLHSDSKFAVTSPVTAVGGIVLDLEVDPDLGRTKAFEDEKLSPSRTQMIKKSFILNSGLLGRVRRRIIAKEMICLPRGNACFLKASRTCRSNLHSWVRLAPTNRVPLSKRRQRHPGTAHVWL